MRIAHIEAGRHDYGGVRQVEYLIAGLAERGVENLLLCPPGHPLATRLPAAEVVEVAMAGDHDALLVPRLVRRFRALAPDIVHVHSRRGADLYGGLAAAWAGLPAVLTRRVQSREPALWARLKYRPYRAVVAISRAVDRELAAAGVAAARRRLIRSAIDVDRMRPRAGAAAYLRRVFGLADDAFVIALVAQLIARKNHAVALAAMERLCERYRQLTLVCFGRGPEEAGLRRLIDRKGLTGRVILAGYRDDLAELMPGVDLLLHPAEREGLGVAVLEAMSAARPVVAVAAGGLVDLIESGVDGVLVPTADAQALAEAIAVLIDAPRRREALGRAARSRVRRDFSVAAMVDAYLDLYASLRGQAHVLFGS